MTNWIRAHHHIGLKRQEAREALQLLLNHPDLAAIPLLVFANKQDVEGAVSSRELEAQFGLKQLLSSSQVLPLADWNHHTLQVFSAHVCHPDCALFSL